ncbi:putative nitric-oxide synthase (NADPH) [Rosa chinensis]|uniref:Putative nitric-oxide synthase (NADPH) n=1 Tax=Rosa chinensis TaxID=74649 RepID=A0A2P6R0K3_ROSCH|nr:putative nitric-oxide synthase (NADPH) [Rosa chinensis]
MQKDFVCLINHCSNALYRSNWETSQCFSCSDRWKTVLPETPLTFYGPKSLQIHMVPTDEADAFYQVIKVPLEIYVL